MGYGLLGLKDHMEGQAMNSFRDLAQDQERNKMAEEQMEQARKSQQMGMAGTGAAVGWAAGAQAGSVGGPWGAAIGAALGFIAGELF